MRDDISRWVDDGIRVTLIGNGTREFAEAFREDFNFAGQLLIDPELAAYRAAGLRRGAEAILSTRIFRDGARAMRSGARQSGVQGDPWQLGGTFVFREGGELLLAQKSESAGDHVSAEEIDEALASDESVAEVSSNSSLLAKVSGATRGVLDVSPVGSFDRIGFLRHAASFDPEDLAVSLAGKRVVVTGANSGIGYAAALALADLGASVTLVCRNQERGETAAESIRQITGNRHVSLCQGDLSDLEDVERVSGILAKDRVDVLIHNAGILPDERGESKDGLELTFATHIAGPHLMTSLLRDALEEAVEGRVIWVSSGGMLTTRLEVDDPQWSGRAYDGVRAYAETKRAQVILAELWAHEFRDTKVRVNSMHPGWADTPAVASSLPRFHKVTEAILRSPNEGADTVVWLAASEPGGRESGLFYFDRMAVRTHWLPMTRERDVDRARLWNLCGGASPSRTESFGLGYSDRSSNSD